MRTKLIDEYYFSVVIVEVIGHLHICYDKTELARSIPRVEISSSLLFIL